VTQEAEQYLAEGGIFASNTSTLPITGLAQQVKIPKTLLAYTSLAL
jgi:3-hydroxyacyl-CoA dehydrogenase/enoyl-CoA hydratase/3-hydroxybutyryl-CoA epimerase